jgi:hypothetical protein
MRSPAEILTYLDQYYAYIIERPSCYALTPAGMENLILFIEKLRAFILDDAEQGECYGRFLDSLGYGAMGCSHREGSIVMMTDGDLELFDRVANVLRQFLEKEGRPLPEGDGT